jgi:hypothetical protein
MTSRPALRPAIAIGAGSGAVACLVVGQSWIYEHVERPAARALCEGECGMGADPISTLFAIRLAALGCILAVVLLGVALRRSQAPGRVLRASLFVTVVVAAASSVVVLHRSDWLRGAFESSVCFAYPDRPRTTGPTNPADCAPEHEPASGAWLLAAGALLAIGIVAAAGPKRREMPRAGQTAPEG